MRRLARGARCATTALLAGLLLPLPGCARAVPIQATHRAAASQAAAPAAPARATQDPNQQRMAVTVGPARSGGT